jgi:hypothetical protein
MELVDAVNTLVPPAMVDRVCSLYGADKGPRQQLGGPGLGLTTAQVKAVKKAFILEDVRVRGVMIAGVVNNAAPELLACMNRARDVHDAPTHARFDALNALCHCMESGVGSLAMKHFRKLQTFLLDSPATVGETPNVEECSQTLELWKEYNRFVAARGPWLALRDESFDLRDGKTRAEFAQHHGFWLPAGDVDIPTLFEYLDRRLSEAFLRAEFTSGERQALLRTLSFCRFTHVTTYGVFTEGSKVMQWADRRWSVSVPSLLTLLRACTSPAVDQTIGLPDQPHLTDAAHGLADAFEAKLDGKIWNISASHHFNGNRLHLTLGEKDPVAPGDPVVAGGSRRQRRATWHVYLEIEAFITHDSSYVHLLDAEPGANPPPRASVTGIERTRS